MATRRCSQHRRSLCRGEDLLVFATIGLLRERCGSIGRELSGRHSDSDKQFASARRQLGAQGPEAGGYRCAYEFHRLAKSYRPAAKWRPCKSVGLFLTAEIAWLFSPARFYEISHRRVVPTLLRTAGL